MEAQVTAGVERCPQCYADCPCLTGQQPQPPRGEEHCGKCGEPHGGDCPYEPAHQPAAAEEGEAGECAHDFSKGTDCARCGAVYMGRGRPVLGAEHARILRGEPKPPHEVIASLRSQLTAAQAELVEARRKTAVAQEQRLIVAQAAAGLAQRAEAAEADADRQCTLRQSAIDGERAAHEARMAAEAERDRLLFTTDERDRMQLALNAAEARVAELEEQLRANDQHARNLEVERDAAREDCIELRARIHRRETLANLVEDMRNLATRVEQAEARSAGAAEKEET